MLCVVRQNLSNCARNFATTIYRSCTFVSSVRICSKNDSTLTSVRGIVTAAQHGRSNWASCAVSKAVSMPHADRIVEHRSKSRSFFASSLLNKCSMSVRSMSSSASSEGLFQSPFRDRSSDDSAPDALIDGAYVMSPNHHDATIVWLHGLHEGDAGDVPKRFQMIVPDVSTHTPKANSPMCHTMCNVPYNVQCAIQCALQCKLTSL
jgi:hypothetical protein